MMNSTLWTAASTNVERATTVDEVMQLARLNWEVSLRDAHWRDDKTGLFHAASDYRMTVRNDSLSVLGVVRKQYSPIQNREGFDFLDALVSEGELKFAAAGSFKGGRSVWIAAHTPQPYRVAGDDHRDLLLFRNTHDGSGAAIVALCVLRIFCENAITRALKDAATREQSFHIIHRGDLTDKLRIARSALKMADTYSRRLRERLDQFAHTRIDMQQLTAYVNTVQPLPPALKDRADAPARATLSRIEGVRKQLVELATESKLNQTRATKGTLFGAFSAVTQYVDHVRKTRAPESELGASHRLESTLFGVGAELKERAFNVAAQLAEKWSDQ